MDAVAMQTEIKAVIDILNDAKERKDVSRLDSAIDRLSTLHRQVGVKTGSGLAGSPGAEPIFHKNDAL
jgi:hypothetical protein